MLIANATFDPAWNPDASQSDTQIAYLPMDSDPEVSTGATIIPVAISNEANVKISKMVHGETMFDDTWTELPKDSGGKYITEYPADAYAYPGEGKYLGLYLAEVTNGDRRKSYKFNILAERESEEETYVVGG